jgi:hypothetical protein
MSTDHYDCSEHLTPGTPETAAVRRLLAKVEAAMKATGDLQDAHRNSDSCASCETATHLCWVLEKCRRELQAVLDEIDAEGPDQG